MRTINTVLVLSVLALLTSCVGVNADIVFNSDNSGTITLEYRISNLMESLGKQDGNEGYPVVPVGRTDLERTVARIPGMKILSWNSRDEKTDRVIITKLQFANPEALLLFFDPSGEKAFYSKDRDSQKMTLVLSEGRTSQNRDLEDLLRRVSAGYKIAMTISSSSEGRLSLLDNEGRPVTDKADLVSYSKKVSFSLPLENILFAQNGIRAEFIW